MLFGRWASRASEAAFPHLWDGLVGAWCPSITGPTGLALLNLSQWSHNGTLTNMAAATDWVSALGYGCLDFDGTNDQVVARTPAALTYTNCTFAGWIRHPGTSVNSGILKAGSGAEGLGFALGLGANSTANSTGTTLRIIGDSVGGFITTGASVSANEWHHIAFVGATGPTQYVYLDGVLVLTRSSTLAQQTTTTFTIGGYTVGAFARYHVGQVDDVVCYNRPLSHSEIDTLAKQRGSLYRLRARLPIGLPVVAATADNVTFGASVVGTPAAGVVVVATANDVTASAIVVGTPAASVTVSATANDVTSSTITVGTPVADSVIAAVANDVTFSQPTIGTPAASVTVTATASGVTASSPIVGTPAAAVTIAATPNSVTAGTITVGSPAADVIEFLTVAEAGSASIVVTASSMSVTAIDADALDMLVVIIAASNAGTDGASSIAGVTDSEGNSYSAIATTNNHGAPSYVNLGTTLGIYAGTVTDALASGTITVNLSPNTPEVAVIVYRVTAAAGSIPSVIASGTGTTGTGTTQTVTSDSIELGDTIFGATAIEYNIGASDDTDSIGGTWSTGYVESTGNPSGTANQSITGQWKSVTASGTQTYNTYVGGSRDYAINWFSLRPVAVVSAVPNDVTCTAPTVGTPSASVTVNATPNDVTSSTPTVDEPEASIGEMVNAVANNVTAGSVVVGEPAATITVNAAANDVELLAVVDSPSAEIVIDFTADDVTSSAVTVETPAASITVNAIADNIESGLVTVGSPSTTITCHFVANEVTCGIPFISLSPLVTLCVDAMSIYVPGMSASTMYQPGTRSGNVYQHGKSRDTIYSPGATDGVYSPEAANTQVGCHQ